MMGSMSVGVTERLRALGGYFGLAPLYALRPRGGSVFSERHLATALVLALCVVVQAGVFLLLLVLLSLAMIFTRRFFEALPMERLALDLWGALWLLWGFAWLLGAYRAWRGRDPAVPVVERVAARLATPGMRRTAAYVVLGCYAALVLTAGAARHASVLARHDPSDAPVQLLYDDMDLVPRWVFALGFYRMSLVAAARWGAGASAVSPLTQENLELALRHGRCVVIASHGDETGFYNRQRWFTPADVAAMERGPSLEFVYITGCDTGALARQWEAIFAPAEVVTFDRLSATLEHAIWLWLRGPALLAALPGAG